MNHKEVKQAAVEAAWGKRRVWVAEAMKALDGHLETLIWDCLREVSDIDDEQVENQIAADLKEEFGIYLERGLGRMFKRMRKEYDLK